MGTNPNLTFYAWQLQKACTVSVVNPDLDPLAPIRWTSPHLGDLLFTPNVLVSSLSHLDPLGKFDFVIISVANLQSFQLICALLEPFVTQNTLVIIECTGYVHLEPFVQLSFPKFKTLTVCSIMSEADVKKHPGANSYVHRVLNDDQRIYLGTSTDESKSISIVRDSPAFTKFYKSLQTVQEHLHGHISLLKSTNCREFMTYQWKLALPRLVLNPLSVVFEEPYPENLEKQILAKPLISGLVNEVFKIIKKMECKLVKGFENEANILKNWRAYFPATKSHLSPDFSDANITFYTFFHQQEIEVDLLLLQPILLGDDHGVRTPYLENLYSMFCQLLKENSPNGSMLFSRKVHGSESKKRELNSLIEDLSRLRLEKQQYDQTHQERVTLLKQIEATIAQKRQVQDSLAADLDKRQRDHEARMQNYSAMLTDKERRLSELDQQLKQRRAALEDAEYRLSQAEAAVLAKQVVQEPAPQPKLVPVEEKVDQYKGTSVTVQDTPDLSDFADVAVYGAALNGEHPIPQETAEQQKKELELQRREQALAERERELNSRGPLDSYRGPQGPANYPDAPGEKSDVIANGTDANVAQPNGGHNPNNGYYNQGNYQNGNYNGAPNNMYRPAYSLTGQNPYNGQYDNSYEQPPHGLPPNGFPQNTLPANLRNPQRYQQNGGQFNQMPQRPRQSSYNNSIRSYDQQMNYPPQQMPPQQMQQMPQQQMPPMPQQVPPQQPQQQMPQQMPPQQMQQTQQMPPQQMQPMPQQQMPHPQQQRPMQNLASHQFMGQPAMGPNNMAGGQMNYLAKKQNRRTAFPDQALNIDYGGRGGMPMPSSGAKHRSMLPSSGSSTSPTILQGKKVPTHAHSSSQNLLPPVQNNSGSLSSQSSHGEDRGDRGDRGDSPVEIRVEVPTNAKPLGSISTAPAAEPKKKRGFLKR